MTRNFRTSVTGQKWNFLGPREDQRAHKIAQRHSLPYSLAYVLVSHNVDLEDVPSHLTPDLEALLPDPFSMEGMDKAVARLRQAIRDKEAIAVFGDYDADGATSVAMLVFLATNFRY